MEKISYFSKRALLFLPFILPLVFLRRVPIFHHAHVRWIVVAILYTYAVPPIIDLIAGKNHANHDPDRVSWVSTAFEYALLPRVLFLKIILLKVLMLEIIATGRFDIVDSLGIAFLTGQSVASYGIFVAHELLHRKSRFDKTLAEIMMVSVMYPHFCIEHLYGHHKYAATPLDPATSRFGETLYAFLPRSIFGGLIDAWRLESRRLALHHSHWFSAWNRMLRYLVEVIAINVIVWYVFGALGFLAFVIQGVVAFLTLEVINYVQHYGLERREIAPGRYRRAEVGHSWNSECWFSNGYWLNLGRHSDHHYEPNRSFQLLRRFEDEPELPAGFPAMFLLAFIPPLWFKVMNPRVMAMRSLQTKATDAAVSNNDFVSEGSRGLWSTENPKEAEPTDWLRGNVAGERWYSMSGNGGLVLMVISVITLIGTDWSYGPPSGFILICIICLVTVGYRHTLAGRLPEVGTLRF